MNETHSALAVEAQSIRLPEAGASRGEAIYRFTDRTEPRHPLHLVMIVRLENDRPVLTSATASAQKPMVERLPGSTLVNLEGEKPTERAPERFNRIARLIIPHPHL